MILYKQSDTGSLNVDDVCEAMVVQWVSYRVEDVPKRSLERNAIVTEA